MPTKIEGTKSDYNQPALKQTYIQQQKTTTKLSNKYNNTTIILNQNENNQTNERAT